MSAEPTSARDPAQRASALAAAAARTTASSSATPAPAVLAEVERSLANLARIYGEVAGDLERLQEGRPLASLLSWWNGAANGQLTILAGGPEATNLPDAVGGVRILRAGDAPDDRIAQDIDLSVIGGLWFGEDDPAARAFASQLVHTPLCAIRVHRRDVAPTSEDPAAAWNATLKSHAQENSEEVLRRINIAALLTSVRIIWRIQTLALVFNAIQARAQEQRHQQWMDERIADDRAPGQAAKRILEREKARIEDVLAGQAQLLGAALDDAEDLLTDHSLTGARLAREALQQLPHGEAVRKNAFLGEKVKRGGLRSMPVLNYLFSQKTTLRFKPEDIAGIETHLSLEARKVLAKQRSRATRKFNTGIDLLSESVARIGVDAARLRMPEAADDASALRSHGGSLSNDAMSESLTAFRREYLDRFTHVHEVKGVFGVLQDLRGVLFGVLFMAVFVAGLLGVSKQDASQNLNLGALQQLLAGLADEWGQWAFTAPLLAIAVIVIAIVAEKMEDQHAKLVAKLEGFHDSAFKQLCSALEGGFEGVNEALLHDMKGSAALLRNILDHHKRGLEDELSDLSRIPPPPNSRAAADPATGFVSPYKEPTIARRLPELQAALAKTVTG